MAQALALITSGVNLATDSSIERSDLVDAIEQLLLGNVSRSHMASTASVVTIGSSAPSTALITGELWLDTSGGIPILKRYDGSSFVNLGLFIEATAPSGVTTEGAVWYDTTLEILRIYDTRDSLAGWHPVDNTLQLCTNQSGGDLLKGALVKPNNTVRQFTTTTTAKDMKVYAVLLEAINGATPAAGVIATFASGMVVDVLVDNAGDDGTVIAGDGLVSFTVGGEARTVGPFVADPHVSATVTQYGTPLGCFGIALGVKDGSDLVRTQLIGYVGAGATRLFTRDSIAELTHLTMDNTYRDIDISNPPDSGADAVNDTKHKPLVSVRFDMRLGAGRASQASTEIRAEFTLSPNGSAVAHHVTIQGQAHDVDGSDAILYSNQNGLWVRTSNSDETGLGQIVQYKGTVASSSPSSQAWVKADIYVTGYIY